MIPRYIKTILPIIINISLAMISLKRINDTLYFVFIKAKDENMISDLSARGSIILPIKLILFVNLAIIPSMASVILRITKTKKQRLRSIFIKISMKGDNTSLEKESRFGILKTWEFNLYLTSGCHGGV